MSKVSQTLASRDRGILERKFIRQVLQQEGQNLVQEHQRAIDRLLHRHSGNTRAGVRSMVQEQSNAKGRLEVQHLKRQRFLDMKTRANAQGIRQRKRAYPIHNRIIFGHLNNIIRQLKFGFTEAVQEKLKRELTLEISG